VAETLPQRRIPFSFCPCECFFADGRRPFDRIAVRHCAAALNLAAAGDPTSGSIGVIHLLKRETRTARELVLQGALAQDRCDCVGNVVDIRAVEASHAHAAVRHQVDVVLLCENLALCGCQG
jgi:hypothetical protein